MAFNQYALRLVVFTVPFDGHRYKHMVHFNGPDDEAFVVQDMRKRAPDLKILELEKVRSEQHVRDKINALRAENEKAGSDYREPTPDELRLTEGMVRALARQFPDVASRLNAVLDPNGNPLIPLDERAKLLEGIQRPATPDHAVAEAVPALKEEFEAQHGPA